MTGEAHEDFRDQSANERQVFHRLMEPTFAGREALREQLLSATVKALDGDGNLVIRVDERTPLADVRMRVPVEAEALDVDGMRISISLHVVNGRASCLERYRIDGTPVKADVRPEALQVFGISD